MSRSSGKPVKSAPDVAPVAQFEQSLSELEQLVAKMEEGELSLDESLRSFERGIALYRRCQTALDQAQARVSRVLDPEHPEAVQPTRSPADPTPPPDDEDLPF